MVKPTFTDGNGHIRASLSTQSGAGAMVFSVDATFTGTTGVQYGQSIKPTINQSSTAGYTALLINPTETATGSGAKLLIDAQVSSSSKFKVDNTGKTTMTKLNISALPTSAAGLSAGDIWSNSGVLNVV